MKNFTIPLLTVLLLIATVAGYGYALVKIQSFVASIAEARGSARMTGAEDEAGKQISTFLTAVAADSGYLENFVVKDAESLRIIEAVEDAAKIAKVDTSITSVSVIPSEWKYHDRIRIVVSGRASFQALSKLVAALEGIPEASRIENISMESAANRTWFGTFTVDFVKEKAGVTDAAKSPGPSVSNATSTP
jgi:hypothetical protein